MTEPRPTPTPNAPKGGRAHWKLWALGIAGLYLVLFFGLNSEKVEVNFVFGSAEASLVVALLIAAALGAVIGWAGPRVRRRPADPK